MIVTKNIGKIFGNQAVLNDISMVFEQGKVNMLIGKSGGGKTVLLKILLGLITPDKGEIFYHNRNFFALSDTDRKKIRTEIGMVFQSSALFDSLNVEANLMLPLNVLTKDTKKIKLQRVNEVLERVNLVGTNPKYPSELSGGMQKRVAIARALILKPKFFFCDEPNSGLDPQTSLVIDSLIRDLTKENNMTTVVISHDMNSILEIGDVIFFLEKGLLAWAGTREEIALSKTESLNKYVFASRLMQEVKKNLMDRAENR